jgi:hypothetical protein
MNIEAYVIDRAIHRLSQPWINSEAEWQHFIRTV